MEDKKPTYTSRMCETLCEKFKTKKSVKIDEVISAIKEFSMDEVERRKEEDEKVKDILHWGKYKGKKISDVFRSRIGW